MAMCDFLLFLIYILFEVLVLTTTSLHDSLMCRRHHWKNTHLMKEIDDPGPQWSTEEGHRILVSRGRARKDLAGEVIPVASPSEHGEVYKEKLEREKFLQRDEREEKRGREGGRKRRREEGKGGRSEAVLLL